MKLFAYNCSQQVQDINYRMIENAKQLRQTMPIGVGSCVAVGGNDINQKDVDYIIAQMSIYGWREAFQTYSSLRNEKFVPIVYSIDKPVPWKILHDIMEHNLGVLTNDGRDRRLEAAVATSQEIAKVDPNAARTLEVIVQEDKPGSIDHNDGVNERITMQDGEKSSRGKRSRR